MVKWSNVFIVDAEAAQAVIKQHTHTPAQVNIEDLEIKEIQENIPKRRK